MNQGTSTADVVEDPWADDRAEPDWETGTVLDEFLPIYQALARVTPRHGAFGQAAVDGMDLSVVAVLLGVRGGDTFDEIAANWRQEYQAEMEQFQREQETARSSS